MQQLKKYITPILVSPLLASLIGVFAAAALNYYFLCKYEREKNLYQFMGHFDKNVKKVFICKYSIKNELTIFTRNFFLTPNYDITSDIENIKKVMNNCYADIAAMRIISNKLGINDEGFKCALNQIILYKTNILNDIQTLLENKEINPLEIIEAKYLDNFGLEWDICLNKINQTFLQ
ncbi:TPA: hypothetical protein ACPSKE_001783 [Legionella feeleii]